MIIPLFSIPGNEKFLSILEEKWGEFLYPDEKLDFINGKSINDIQAEKIKLSKNIPTDVIQTIRNYCNSYLSEEAICNALLYIMDYFFCAYDKAKSILSQDEFKNIKNIETLINADPKLVNIHCDTIKCNRAKLACSIAIAHCLI